MIGRRESSARRVPHPQQPEGYRMGNYRTATAAEIQRDLDRHRRAKQALDNHRRPPRTPGARIRDAIDHVRSNKKPAAFAEASGLGNTTKESDLNYGTNKTEGQR